MSKYTQAMSRHGALRAYGSLYEVECMLKSGYKGSPAADPNDRQFQL